MVATYGCIDIIIKRSALDKCKNTNSEEFIRKEGIKNFYYDRDLVCVPGGMSPQDAKTSVEYFEQCYGIEILDRADPKHIVAKDGAVVNGPFGLTTKCSWLEKENEWWRMKKTLVSFEKVNWNPEQWLNKFHITDNYRAVRKEVFISTKEICENNGYVTSDGKEVVLYDPPASIYYGKEITKLPKINNSEPVKIHVLEEDCLLTAHRLADKNPLVLNMASRSNPGGGVENGAGAQEECLFRSSNYYRTLYALKERAYPMDRNFGACYSPQVTVFRGLEEDGYPLLEEPFQTNFIAVAALNRPEITEQGRYTPGEQAGMMNKIRTILNVAMIHGYKTLILSAFGCGAFANPPRLVAQCFRDALSEQPYCNAFSDIYFSIKADHNDKQRRNFTTFKDVLSSKDL